MYCLSVALSCFEFKEFVGLSQNTLKVAKPKFGLATFNEFCDSSTNLSFIKLKFVLKCFAYKCIEEDCYIFGDPFTEAKFVSSWEWNCAFTRRKKSLSKYNTMQYFVG